jgi:hypothetical protein
VAGERRYRAAVKASVMELPAIVRPAGAGDEDEEAALLIEAVLENDQRVDLDSLSRARGYQRLVNSGLTIKGVAERCSTTQARVREHLRILKLPDPVQHRVATGEVPLRAVKPLEALAKIHSGLASAAVKEIITPREDYDAYTWADLEHDPLAIALSGEQPIDGVYKVHEPHPIESFTLTGRATNDLKTLEKLIGSPLRLVRFGHEELDQARALGAVHGENWSQVIVGHEVADQLAADYIARCVKTQKANQRRQQTTPTQADAGGDAAAGGEDAQAGQDARRAQREQEREQRAAATAFNLELGRAVYGTLSRVKVDERAIKLISSIDVTGQLSELAMRGARYGFPGWVGEATGKGGTVKYEYVDDRAELGRLAAAFLSGARATSELVGRQVALLAMAVYADQDAIATSRRCWHHVTPRGPWAGEFDELLDEIVVEKLPESMLAVLQPRIEQRRIAREQRDAERKERTEALGRLDGIEERMSGLSGDELDVVEQDLDRAYPGYDPRRGEIRRVLSARRAALGEQQPS